MLRILFRFTDNANLVNQLESTNRMEYLIHLSIQSIYAEKIIARYTLDNFQRVELILLAISLGGPRAS